MESPWSMSSIEGKGIWAGDPILELNAPRRREVSHQEEEGSWNTDGFSQCGHRLLYSLLGRCRTTSIQPAARRCCCWDVSAVSAVSAYPASALSFQSFLGVAADLNLVASGSSRFETASSLGALEGKKSCRLSSE